MEEGGSSLTFCRLLTQRSGWFLMKESKPVLRFGFSSMNEIDLSGSLVS